MKRERRKPKRRSFPKAVAVPSDLAQLAIALDEARLEKNSAGWFSMPWNDGINAFNAAHQVWLELCVSWGRRTFVYWPKGRVSDASYEQLEHWRQEAWVLGGEQRCAPDRILAAGIRCLQLKIAASHGGGVIYNEVLRGELENWAEDVLEEHVRKARRDDALGDLRNSPKHIAAFDIAWERGLYRAAYAIAPRPL